MRRLGRDTLVYAGGTLLSRLVSFVMLPVYTRYLTPADYGILQLLDVTLDIAAIILSAGAISGVMRFYFKTDDEDRRRRVLSTAYLTQLALNLLGTAVIIAMAPLLWRLLLGSVGSPWYVRIAAANFTLGVLASVPLMLLQIRQESGRFVALMIVKLVLQLSLNILFVVVLRAGPMGVLLSTFVSNLAFGGALSWRLLRHTGLRFDRQVLGELRRYGVPYQLERIGTFIITFGDRFFLKAFHGLAAVGLYGIAYQFGFLLTGTLATPLYRAWNPQRHQLVHLPPAERDARYNRSFRLLSFLLVSGGTGVALFITPLLRLLVTAEFQQAAYYVPIILLASIFHAWISAVGFGIAVAEKTRYAALATYIATAVVLVLYATLIPPFGPLGAAVATLGGTATRFFLMWHYSHRLWPVRYDWGPHALMVGAGMAVTAAWFVLAPGAFMAQVALAMALFLVYLSAAWFLAVPRADREAIQATLLTRTGLSGLMAD